MYILIMIIIASLVSDAILSLMIGALNSRKIYIYANNCIILMNFLLET